MASAFAASAYAAEIETVTVTAQKREQDIQSVPIAVSAFSGETLKAAEVRDIQDLQLVSPSLLISTGSGETTGSLARIRGIGTTGNNIGLEGAVGIFIDGVYRNRTATAINDLVDIERVEVLRGPQGTLFGKNTTAGAISIITRKPTFDTEIEGSASYGNLNGYRVTGLISGAVEDDVLAMSLAGYFNKRDGFVRDVDTGRKYNDRDRWGLKGQALWTPAKNVSFRLIGDYSEKNENCCVAPYMMYGRHPTLPLSTTQIVDDLAALIGRTNPVPYTGPLFPANVATLLAIPPNANIQSAHYQKYLTSVNSPRVSNTRDWGVSGQLDWIIDDTTSFTSITAYRKFDSHDAADVDYGPADILASAPTRIGTTFFSQEGQLKGNLDKWLDWLLGAYYSHETIDQVNSVTFGTQATEYFARLLAPAASGQISKCIRGQNNLFPGCNTAGVAKYGVFYLPGQGYTNHFSQTGSSWALFTHNTAHLGDQLALTIGIRYNHESKHGTFDTLFQSNTLGSCPNTDGSTNTNLPLSLRLLCPRVSYDRKFDESAWTGTVNLAYTPTDNVMAYISYSHGYKAGGFNLDRDAGTAGGVRCTPASHPPPCPVGLNTEVVNPIRFSAETASSEEIGVRTTWFDSSVIANLTGFYTQFSNYQLNTFGGLGFTISNIGSVHSEGFEFESYAAPFDGMLLSAAATFAESQYGQAVITPGYLAGALGPSGHSCGLTPAAFGGAVPPVGPRCLQGRTITQAPKWTLTGSANYETPLDTMDLTAFIGVNANYRSRYNTGSDLDVQKIQGGFILVNGRVGVRTDDNHWEFEVWGRNILDKHYKIVGFDSVAQGGTWNVFVGEPATYGVTLTAHM
ncbi:MAG: TonB-dependent receptor [Proteobacteria bacterium]|nr:TonB-dependent receptor [Pseudomonadota bacterium]